MENENFAITLSVMTLIIIMVVSGVFIYQNLELNNLVNNQNEKQNNLQSSINTNSANIEKINGQISNLQNSVNQLTLNYANYDTTKVNDLKNDISEISYCSERYSDYYEFDQFADCLNRRIN